MDQMEVDSEELDLRSADVRIAVLEDIKSEENYRRKRDQQKRFDVYNDRQDIYILERLRREFSIKTVNDMRKILSINLAKRIIDEKSSVYCRPPVRTFYTRSGVELSEDQDSQIEHLYKWTRSDMMLKRSNVFYNLHDQCAIMVVPDKMGGFKTRAIPPIHYDVVPSTKDPERAHAYILNVWDFNMHSSVRDGSTEPTQLDRYKGMSDSRNQKTADDDDRQALLQRYVVWTKDYHYVMDGKGNIKGEVMPNPIGILPFIDVAPLDKDFQFFVRRGSSTVDFSLDYGMMLSDNANVIRLQAYSQAVIASEEIPNDMTVGPNHILHLKLDPDKPELNPSFQFVTPSPDLAGTQAFLESMLNLHLTSEGQDPSILSPKGDGGQRYQSGLDRLLAMISKFEATRDDFDMYRGVEQQLCKIISRWSNAYQNTVGEGSLDDGLKGAMLPEDLMVDVKFAEPEAVQTKKDLEDSVIKLLGESLISRKEAIMKLRDVSAEKADEILTEIDMEEGIGRTDIQKIEGGAGN